MSRMTGSPALPVDEIHSEAELTQARHELHRAIDFGQPDDLAEWAKKWGEAALKMAAEGLDASEDSHVADDGPVWPEAAQEAKDDLTEAKSKIAAANAALAAKTIDLSGLAQTLGQIEQCIANAMDAVTEE